MNQLTTQSLYDQDFALWIDDTVAKLRAQKFDQIDLENLIEEIESLGKSDKREIKSRLVVLLAHLLKRIYIDSTDDNGGWRNTINEQRRELIAVLEDSPSLKNHFEAVFDTAYQTALSMVRKDYKRVVFPDEWQFDRTIDSILTATLWKE